MTGAAVFPCVGNCWAHIEPGCVALILANRAYVEQPSQPAMIVYYSYVVTVLERIAVAVHGLHSAL